ncbi:MAG: DUF4007 family protein [Anaerolineaceae bacterium]
MKLQFTNGYRPHFDQVTRILQYLLANGEQQKIPRKDIVDKLGIPNRQVENLTSMMVGFGLVMPRTTKLTSLGRKIIQSDPYFEKTETLWIVHYNVSSDPDWVVWHRIVNTVMHAKDEFEVDDVSKQYFSDIEIHYSERTISEKLPTEIGAVLAAYMRSDLSKLGLFDTEASGRFIKTTPKDVPLLAFLYALIRFRDNHSPGSSAVNINDICYEENSPGRVMNIDEYQVRALLNDLHDFDFIRLEKLANLDQVRLNDKMTQEAVTDRIYGDQDEP